MTSPNRAAGEQKAKAMLPGLTEEDQTTKTTNSKNHPIQKTASNPEVQTEISNLNLSETKKISNQEQADVILNRKIRNHRASNLVIVSLNPKIQVQVQKIVASNQEAEDREIINQEPATEILNRKMEVQEITNREQETEILNQEKVEQEIISQEQENAISNLRMEIREILNRELVVTRISNREANQMVLNQVQEAQEM
ncbi:hypothetical protein D3C87_1103550 [compost metagenome]